MNFLALDLLVAGHNAIKYRKENKKNAKRAINEFEAELSKEELKKELKEAEKLYKNLIGKDVSKKKLNELYERINLLEFRLDMAHMIEKPSHYLKYKNMIITPPEIGEIESELEKYDKELMEKFKGEISLYDRRKSYLFDLEKFHVLNLPPPPRHS